MRATDIESLSRLGHVAFKEGHYEQALSYYEQASAADIDHQCKAVWFNKAVALIKLDRRVEAWEALTTAIKIDPDYTKAKQKKLICENHAAAKLFFGIVDLKVTAAGQVKILEFGQGVTSGATCYDNHVPASDSIRHKLLALVEKEGLPLYLNSWFGAPHLDNTAFITEHQLGRQWARSETFKMDDLHSYWGIYAGIEQMATDATILHEGDALAALLMCDDKVAMHPIPKT